MHANRNTIGEGVDGGAAGSGRVWVVSGASGVGKTSLIKTLLVDPGGMEKSVSYTTRALRGGEEEGSAYHRVSVERFRRMVEAGEFLEHAEVHGNWYGTPKAPVLERVGAGGDMLLEIDWQGAERVRRLLPEAVLIFILPPDWESLRLRLRQRGQDEPGVIERRLRNAARETRRARGYDYVVINGDFDLAWRQIKDIIVSVRAGGQPARGGARSVIDEWLAANGHQHQGDDDRAPEGAVE